MREVSNETEMPRVLSTRYGPTALVFLSSGCIMVLEIVAGRLIARHLGTSLYTWTSVIGVVLGGIALGNYLGGRLAERFNPARLLGSLFIGGALVTVAILGLDYLVASRELFDGLTWPVRIALSVTVIFFLPCTVLGTVSPVVATAALAAHKGRIGHLVGSLYAAGAAGSIVGTFLTGFVLIGVFGTKSIVFGVAGMLGALALTLVRGPRQQLTAAVIVGLGFGTGVATSQEPGWVSEWVEDPKTGDLVERPTRYEAESDYFHVVVVGPEQLPKGDYHPDTRALVLDAMVHGFVVPGMPGRLEYGYEQLTAALTKRAARGRTKLRTLTIGGGAYTFPRYVEFSYPGSVVDVVEIDPAVTKAAHEALGLPLDTTIKSYNEDARVFMRRDELASAAAKYDFIYGDAFSGFSVPWHLTTQEFNQTLRDALTPDGAYILNLIDSQKSQKFVGASYHTLKSVFDFVAVFGVTGEQTRETYVIYASQRPIDIEGLEAPDGRAMGFEQLDEGRLRQLSEACNSLVLSDDFAPVDQLTAPIYEHRRQL